MKGARGRCVCVFVYPVPYGTVRVAASVYFCVSCYSNVRLQASVGNNTVLNRTVHGHNA